MTLSNFSQHISQARRCYALSSAAAGRGFTTSTFRCRNGDAERRVSEWIEHNEKLAEEAGKALLSIESSDEMLSANTAALLLTGCWLAYVPPHVNPSARWKLRQKHRRGRLRRRSSLYKRN